MIFLKLFFWCFCIPSAVFLIYHFLTRKYLNPHKLYMIFGKKGAGKTTLLTKLSLHYSKRGRKVYCTEPVYGAYLISPEDVATVLFPPGSVILIDEVSLVWSNRGFKDFSKDVERFFRKQRHRGNTVYLFSQTFDVDKKIRDLVDAMYLIQNKFRVFSYAKKISKLIVLTESVSGPNGESRIAENLSFEPFILFPFGTRKLTYIPRYTKYFDSYSFDPEEASLIPAADMHYKRVR